MIRKTFTIMSSILMLSALFLFVAWFNDADSGKTQVTNFDDCQKANNKTENGEIKCIFEGKVFTKVNEKQ